MRVQVDDFLLVCAFRYALGRSTYAVGIVADDLIRLAPQMRLADRELVVIEIDEADTLTGGSIGMDMDHRRWMQVRNAMRVVDAT